MPKPERPVHFEVNADDPERAVKFYQNVFGWKISKWSGPMDYWMVDTGPGKGINGGIMKRLHPQASTVNTVQVESLDKSLEKVRRSGGKTLGEKMEIPGAGTFIYCQDTEGNAFGMIQPPRKAQAKPAKKAAKSSKKRK